MMRSKWLGFRFLFCTTIALCFTFFSPLVASQEVGCNELKSLYQDKKYTEIIGYEKIAPPNFNPEASACLKNLAGLSWLKMHEEVQDEFAGYALQLFGTAANEGYLPAAFNLLKYEYLLTNAALDPLLSGLTALVNAGVLDDNRKVSVLSYELGNRIIDDCFKSSETVCKKRRVSNAAVNDFMSNSDRLLSQVRETTNARTAGERATQAKIAFVLSILMFAANAAITAKNIDWNSVNNYLYNRPPPQAPNPVTHPWLFPQPAKPMTCWQGYCW